jgi:hypothetical protein
MAEEQAMKPAAAYSMQRFLRYRGPTGTLLNELADASFYHANCRIIFVSRQISFHHRDRLTRACTAHCCILLLTASVCMRTWPTDSAQRRSLMRGASSF